MKKQQGDGICADQVRRRKRVLAVASLGGHWIQLLRIMRGLEGDYDVIYCSTHAKCAEIVAGHEYYDIKDFSRWDVWKLPATMVSLIGIILKTRPEVVMTTGAAPGLTALLAARICGVRTVWIDSIANVECLSASGRMARRIADRVYTQWPSLAGDGVVCAGNVFG